VSELVGVYYKIQSGSHPEQRKEMEIKYPTLRSTIPALGKETVPTAHTSVRYQNLLVYEHIRNSTIQTTILSTITTFKTSRVISRCQGSQNIRNFYSYSPMLVTSINKNGKKNIHSPINTALVTRWNKKSLGRCSSVFPITQMCHVLTLWKQKPKC